ncbi:hypothetical protein [Vagococcus hydrophili]|uniref:Uncharacterized protein n=1 Tax=Vagococcus hydrophili TaxID=2714947 RepID=A0A6G8ASN0_9ENTE|nr:hypothetical protein [Vagococcus hydrophili]QIL48081.1 hypothetical protein G7082_05925 [Vagococcus hydrophili]
MMVQIYLKEKASDFLNNSEIINALSDIENGDVKCFTNIESLINDLNDEH